MKHFSKNQLVQARRTDLYDFLISNHPSDFKRDGNSIHPRNNDSISIKKGYSGYKDFATDETGNAIDFLIRYMGYELDEAVFALCGDVEADDIAKEIQPVKGKEQLPVSFPTPASGTYKNLYAYLKSRGISNEVITMLIKEGLIYQDEHNNIVFINKEKNWGEIRGTNTFADARCIHRAECEQYCKTEHQWCSKMKECEKYKKDSFRGMVANSKLNGFWWFQTGEAPAERVFICEASIDAISLYEINRRTDSYPNSVYVSIGGTAKQPAIERLKHHKGAILAVDNDKAGEDCRNRNLDISSIVPTTKDWNEDLVTNNY